MTESHITRILVLGASATAFGIALCSAGTQTPGGIVLVAGVLLVAFGLHRYGRLGAVAGSEHSNER